MAIAIVVLVFTLSALFIGRTMLKKAGFKNPGGKPDCGCGTCEKKSEWKLW